MKNFKIEWYINDTCNQKCSYCLCEYSKSKSGCNKIIEPELVHNLSSNILSLGSKTYDFVLLGGEPILYPDLVGLLEQMNYEFRGRILNFLLSTNASLGESYFKRFLPFKNNLTIRFSMHPQYYSDEWINTINFFLKNQFKLQCDILFDLNYRENTLKSIELLNKIPNSKNLQKSIKAVYFSNSHISNEYRWKEVSSIYSSEDIELIKNYNKSFNYSTPDVVMNKKYCLVGSNKFNLDYLGRVQYFCKFQYNFPSLFYLSAKKFKENLLHIVKCPHKYCQYAKSILPYQSNKLDQLKQIKNEIIGWA